MTPPYLSHYLLEILSKKFFTAPIRPASFPNVAATTFLGKNLLSIAFLAKEL